MSLTSSCPPFRRPLDQKKQGLWGRDCRPWGCAVLFIARRWVVIGAFRTCLLSRPLWHRFLVVARSYAGSFLASTYEPVSFSMNKLHHFVHSSLGSVSIPFPLPSEGRCDSLHARLTTKPHPPTGHMGMKIDITFSFYSPRLSPVPAIAIWNRSRSLVVSVIVVTKIISRGVHRVGNKTSFPRGKGRE